MKQIFVSSVQKEFERERAAIKRMIETDPIIKPHFKAFVFEIDAPAADKTARQVYLEEIENSDVYLLLVGDKYGYCKEGSVSPTEQEYDKAVELGKTKLVMVRGTDGASADDVQEIPNSVIAEAVNNAVAHWNYASPGSVQVEVYRDRVEVINPGRLHCSMTVADLYKKHESLPPNLRIAHTMYYAKYIEELGTGITELLKKCRKHGLKRPLLEESSGKFRIVLWRRVNKKFGRAESLRFELQVVEYLKSVGENGAKLSDLQQFAGALPRRTCQSSLRKLRKEGKIRMEGSTSAAKWFPVYQ